MMISIPVIGGGGLGGIALYCAVGIEFVGVLAVAGAIIGAILAVKI